MTTPTQVAGECGRHIVFVHGRGFKPAAPTCLSLLWRALEAGVTLDVPEEQAALEESARTLAYYGDLTNALLGDGGDEYDEQLDVNDLENALNELKTLDRKKGFGVKNYDRLPGKSAAREFAVSLFAPIVESIGLGKKIVSGRHKDLGAYWEEGNEYRASALARVRDAICEALDSGDRVVLLSHGTGSIITWDALWQLSHEEQYAEPCRNQKVDLWITLGSPLGDTMVQKQLLGAGESGRTRFPANVIAWHNVSAEDDYLSHDNTVSDDFSGMLSQRQISSIRDYRVYNLAIRYGRSNPHNVLGYLIHPRVARIMTDWMRLVDGRSLPKAPDEAT